GASHAVLESSSHGFAQHRLDAVSYALGVFTNLAPEHLDHHGTLEAYREAKATLMRRAPLSVLNRDDAAYAYLAAAAPAHVAYGEHARADVRLLSVTPEAAGLALELDVHGERLAARLPLVGRYNAHNAAAAVAAAVAEGLAPAAAAERLASFPGVPGRMQVVGTRPTVIVDFAHTAPALAKALEAVRRPGSRVIVVVGSAGERDPGKRGPLGAAAVRGAALAVLTDADSRSASVDAILAAVGAGAAAGGGGECAGVGRGRDRPRARHPARRGRRRRGRRGAAGGQGPRARPGARPRDAGLGRGGRGAPGARGTLDGPVASAMDPLRPVDLILAKRAGQEHAPAELTRFIDAYVAGEVPDYQVAAWLMAVCWRGMTDAETAALTQAMARSGDMLDLSGLPHTVDKHSTGGVGDKTTLVLAPLLAAMGGTVAKMSGR